MISKFFRLNAVQNLRYKRNSKLNSKPSSKLGTKFVSVLKLVAILFFGSIAANANAQNVDIGPVEYPLANNQPSSAAFSVTMAITITNGSIPANATVQWFSFERDANNPATPKIDSKQNISGATERTFVVGQDYDSQRPFLGVEIGGFSTGNRGFAVAGVPALRSEIGNGDTRNQQPGILRANPVVVGSTLKLNLNQVRGILGNIPSDNAFNVIWYRTSRYQAPQSDWISIGVGHELVVKAGDFAPGYARLHAELFDNSYPNGFGVSPNQVTKTRYNSHFLYPPIQALRTNDDVGRSDQLAIEAIGTYAVGSTLTINTSRFNDANGNGVFTAEWLAVNRSTGATIASFATGLSYVVDVSDFPEAQRENTDIKVLVKHTDALGLNQGQNGGFVATFIPPVWRLVPPAPTGSLSIVPTGTGRTQNDELRGTPNGGLALNGFSFQWQGRQIGSIGENSWTNIQSGQYSSAVEATLKYTGTGNTGTWDTNHEVLRLSANLGNPFGTDYVFRTQPFTLNLLPTVPTLIYTDTSDVNNLSVSHINNDPNGGPRNYSFMMWFPGRSDNPCSCGGTQNMNPADINLIAAGTQGTVVATNRDFFNFENKFTIAMRFAKASVRIENTRLIVTLENYAEIVESVESMQWYQGSSDTAVGTAISGANTSVYTIPSNFDRANPYFYAQVVYNTPFHPSNNGGNFAQLTASSPRTNGQGLLGTLKIAAITNYNNNAIVSANVSDLRDVFGITPAITALQYQWQTGTSTLSTDTWTNVGAQNNSGRFTLLATDFNNTKKYLRVVGTSAGSADFTSPPLDIDRPISNIQVDLVSPGTLGNYSPGAILTLATAFIDPNGNGGSYAIRFEKIVGNVTSVLSANARYTVRASDFPPTEIAVVQIKISGADAFGFVSTVSQVVPLQIALAGTMVISGRDFTRNGTFTADLSNVTDPNGTLRIDYQWQVNRPLPLVDDPNPPPNTVPANAPEWIPVPNDLIVFNNPFDSTPDSRMSPVRNINQSTFSLLPRVAALPGQEPRWNPRLVSLRVRAVHIDGFNAIATLYSQPIRLNKSTKGAPLLDISDTGGATVVSVDFSKITDGNSLNYPPQFADGVPTDLPKPGQGTFYYQWENFQGNFQLGTSAVYQLTDNDIRAIRAGFQPQLRAIYRDGIGFGREWIIPIDLLQVAVTQNGRNFRSALTESGLQSGTYSYQWLQSSIVIRSGILPNTSGEYTPIISVTSANYAVDAATYDNSKPFVRLLVRSSLAIPTTTTTQIVTCGGGTCSSGSTNKQTSTIEEINLTGRIVRRQALSEPFLVAGITAGTVQIDRSGSTPNFTYTANSSNLRNVFGETPSRLTYQWIRGKVSVYGPFAPPNAWEPIVGATAETYRFNLTDFPDTNRYLQVIVTDGSGYFSRDARLFGVPVGVPIPTTITILGGYRPADVLTAVVGGLGEAVTYRWQGGSADGIWEDLADRSVLPYARITTSTYTIPPQDDSGIQWNANLVSVRVIATNGEDTLTAVVLLNKPTEGTPLILSDSSGASTVVSVNIESLTDANGKGSATYQWIENNGTLKSGETNAAYSLTPQDIQNIATNAPPGVVIIYRDALGFASTFTLTVQGIGVQIALSGSALQAAVTDEDGVALNRQISWQRGDANATNYEDIGGASGNRYEVPINHPSAKPLVRAQLSYLLRGQNSTVFSTPIRVAGIASGNAQLNGTSFAVGAEYSADLSALLDVLGRVPQAAAVSYQWQNGTTAGSDWQDIAQATTQIYALQVADFGAGRSGLRLVLTDLAENPSSSANLTATTNVNDESSGGTLRIIEPPAAIIGALFRADISGITDGNGTADSGYSYQWLSRLAVGGALTEIAGATAAIYTLAVGDFRDDEMPDLVLRVRYTDLFGFVNNISSSIEVQEAATGEIRITTNGYGFDAVFGATAIVQDSNGSVTFVSRQWGQMTIGGNLTTDFVILSGETDDTYTLKTDWNVLYETLLLQYVVSDPFNVTTTLTSSPGLQINRQTQGLLALSGTDVQLSMGSMVTVGTDDLTDENNTAANTPTIISYEWVSGASITVGSERIYTLTETDISLSEAGQNLSVFVVYQDGVGFRSTIFATLILGGKFLLEEIESLVRVAAVLNLLETQAVVGAIDGHLDSFIIGGGTGDSGGSFMEINNRRLHGREDILSALNSRTANSINEGQDLAIDNFAAQQNGGVQNSEWTTWVQGGWSILEGAPIISGSTVNYDGDAFGIYGGYDRQYGKEIRVGLAAGRSEVKIKAALTEGEDAKEDTVERRINSLLPYFQWRRGNSKVRVIGGYGAGELELEQGDGTCKSNVNVDLLVGAISGEYSLPQISARLLDLEAAVVGNLSYARSRAEAGVCNDLASTKLPASDAGSGEIVLGGRVHYQGETPGYSYSPRIGLDVRRPFGDLSDDIAYDFIGGILVDGNLGFILHLEGRTQLNGTTHQRDSFSGKLEYNRGSVYSLWRSEMDLERGEHQGLVHRLEMGYTDGAEADAFGGNLYIERHLDDSPATKLGGEFRIGF